MSAREPPRASRTTSASTWRAPRATCRRAARSTREMVDDAGARSLRARPRSPARHRRSWRSSAARSRGSTGCARCSPKPTHSKPACAPATRAAVARGCAIALEVERAPARARPRGRRVSATPEAADRRRRRSLRRARAPLSARLRLRHALRAPRPLLDLRAPHRLHAHPRPRRRRGRRGAAPPPPTSTWCCSTSPSSCRRGAPGRRRAADLDAAPPPAGPRHPRATCAARAASCRSCS